MRFWLGILLVAGSVLHTACMRNDDEPIQPERPISRLYVSFLDYQTDETKDPFLNLSVIENANSNQLTGNLFNSGTKGGGSVHFNPFDSRVFQGSVNDSTIMILSVTHVGIPQVSGFLTHENLTGIRGLSYNNITKKLFVANSITPSGVYVFNNPLNRRGSVRPDYYFNLNGVRPWSIAMWDDNMLVTRTGENGGVNLYDGIATTDSLGNGLRLVSSLQVEGANDLRGMFFSKEADLMVLTDFASAKVMIFENAMALFSQSSGTIRPTRVLSGASTQLQGPIDIAVDIREGSTFLYVADRLSKKVYRYPLQAGGNVEPEAIIDFGGITPNGLFLDARGNIF
jgi:hypothetical protein